MKLISFLKVFLIVNFIDQIVASNVFTIIGPKVLRKGEPYKCAVSGHDLKSASSFNITLSGFAQDSRNFLRLSHVVKINSSETRTVDFSTENFPIGSYKITAVGLEKPSDFFGEKELVYLSKTFSIFIQTDKAIYKANDLIRFRVFAISPQSLPYSVKGWPEITISDPSDNTIKQYTNMTFVKGKYESELLLSSSPPIGSWSIQVKVEGEVFSKSIEVQEYTLPAFSASVSAPKNVAYADGHVPITVSAQYTFGQKVEGSAVVTFKQYGYKIVYERLVMINSSSTTFDVDIKRDLQISQLYNQMSILVEVQFTDKQTAQLAAASTEFNLVQFRHTIVFQGAPTFKRGLPYVFKLTVKKLDGSPAAENSQISIQIDFDGKGKDKLNQTFTLDSTGSVDLEENVPLVSAYFMVKVSFADADLYRYISAASSRHSEFLSIDVLTLDPALYFDIDIDFHVTEDIPFVNVVMISKGIIVLSEKVKVQKRLGTLTFNPKFEFAPTTKIIAYYVNVDQQIISDSTTITLRDRLPNFLNLAINPTTCKPGETVQLSIGTTIQSTVSLLAIDQRVLLLKSGNDISLNDVFGNLDQYNQIYGGNIFNDFVVMRRPNRPWMWYETYEMKFEEINLFIISNALNDNPDYRYSEYETERESIAMASHNPEKPMPQVVDDDLVGSSRPEAPKLRKDFSESFLWKDVEILKLDRSKQNKNRGREVINVKVPESITSYVVSGVSMNNRFGLALPFSLPSLTIFQPFFIQFTLPFSIKRGEKLRLDIFVFNFLSNAQSVTVSIDKYDAEFYLQNPAGNGWNIENQRYFQTFNSSADSTKKLTIYLVAKILGFVTLKVTAIGNLAGDAIEQKLRVVPEGLPRYITNSTIIVKNSNTNSVAAELSCTLPPTAVNDTIKVSASVAGDILGSSLHGLEKLIQMPYGCGEQNMLNFVPNIVILKYLEATNQLTPAIKTKTVGFTELGYQRELQYRRSDGSFSAFGNSDPFGSTWLTGFVLKSFSLAKSYVTIDMMMLEESFNFLISKQNKDGSFREDGRVIHSDMQGGSSSGIPLTAYIAIVLTECLPNFPQYSANRDRALNYVISNYNESDVYALGILSYALSLANHPSYSLVFYKFYNLAIETASELHWSKVKDEDPNQYWHQPSSLDVEISSYALLALYNKDLSKSLKLIRWIVKQQNSLGGFQSTQDTVVALEALSKFAAQFTLPTSSISLTATPDVGNSFNASINSANSLVLQAFDLLSSVRKLNVLTSNIGTGLAIVSLSCNYYEVIDNQTPRFIIDHSFEDPCLGHLKSSVCLSYIPRDNDEVSNMVLLTFKLPSGFIYEERKSMNGVISKVETAKGGSEVNIYMNSLSEKTFCFYINAIQVNYVEELKGGTIEVTDYYDTSKKASAVYSVPPLLPCQPKPSIGNSEDPFIPID